MKWWMHVVNKDKWCEIYPSKKRMREKGDAFPLRAASTCSYPDLAGGKIERFPKRPCRSRRPRTEGRSLSPPEAHLFLILASLDSLRDFDRFLFIKANLHNHTAIPSSKALSTTSATLKTHSVVNFSFLSPTSGTRVLHVSLQGVRASVSYVIQGKFSTLDSWLANRVKLLVDRLISCPVNRTWV